MAISKLSELQTALADRLARSDFTATVQLECINMAEARMMRELRTNDMETKNASFSINGQYVTAPTVMAAVRTFLVTSGGDSWTLQESTPELIVTAYPNGSGKPKDFAVVGSEFMFGPTPDTTYTATLVYYARITPLASANDTNWLLRDHPDCYLHGALHYAGVRLQDANLAASYEQLFTRDLESLKQYTAKKRWTGPALMQRPG